MKKMWVAMFLEKLVESDVEQMINDLKRIENLEPGKESKGLIILHNYRYETVYEIHVGDSKEEIIRRKGKLNGECEEHLFIQSFLKKLGIDTYGEHEDDREGISAAGEIERKVGYLACVFYQKHIHEGTVGYKLLSGNELKAGRLEKFDELAFYDIW